ncbi:MAG: hypothetical protein COB35_07740 [Gammaproteobacteria bacterium]|nr:MAG: hypothetical protein COB35_07740 [Gammaproteobacteria bacterium]
MSTGKNSQNIQSLSRSNSELKHALQHFIDCAPNSGPLIVQIDNIKKALKSNETMFTFAALVEQYAKMKKNFDKTDYQSKKKDLNTLKSLLKKSLLKNLSSNQSTKISAILTDISQNQPDHVIMVAVGKALEGFSEDLSVLRSQSKIIIGDREVTSEETGVMASDIHLASKRLLKDVITISNQLIKTYPNDQFILNLIEEASQVTDQKGTFFKSINLLERSTTYLALLIQQERCAAEEMLNDIHASIVDVVKHTTVLEKLMNSNKDDADGVKNSMAVELKNMEVKSRAIDTIEGMQNHIKDSVALMSHIMNDYAETQNQINLTNDATIDELTFKVNNASSFVEKLEEKLELAEESNLLDELTTVGNRKGYVQAINKERKSWAASRLPLTLMVIDVDKFKSVNDNYGHSVGDQVLKCLGQTLKKHIRSTDYVARYGGEEFAIILPATDVKKAVRLGQKLKETINNLKFELRKKNKVLRITCSFGISTFTEKAFNTIDVFNAADKALYQAKNNGRNAIVVSSAGQYNFIDNQQAAVK